MPLQVFLDVKRWDGKRVGLQSMQRPLQPLVKQVSQSLVDCCWMFERNIFGLAKNSSQGDYLPFFLGFLSRKV